MNQKDNIEKLFKETFEHFEADVDPKMWTTIQGGIKTVSGYTASSVSKFAIAKTIATITIGLAVVGSIWYVTRTEDKTSASLLTTQNKIEAESKEAINSISANDPESGPSSAPIDDKTGASASQSLSPSQQISDNTPLSQPVSNASNTGIESTTSTDNSTGPSQPAHKYGNSSSGPTPLIRGNQIVKSHKSTTSDADSQETEVAPVANIVASTESGDAPLTVVFSNQGIASSLSWDFGDGSGSRENSPSHTFDKPGNYSILLTAKNSMGNASDKIVIEVAPLSDITTIPNVFSPNEDGKNDFFYFGLKNISSIEVSIVDRAGNLIYKWNGLEGKWDGKNMSGADVTEGVYFYVLKAIGTDNTVITKKGSVTLTKH